jgi:hypothetical protein
MSRSLWSQAMTEDPNTNENLKQQIAKLEVRLSELE